jgi:hypothetical protein
LATGILLAPRLPGACTNAFAAAFLFFPASFFAAAAPVFFEVAISVPASRDAEGFVEFAVPGLQWITRSSLALRSTISSTKVACGVNPNTQVRGGSSSITS